MLDGDDDAVWSLLLASGYLKAEEYKRGKYRLSLTNYEIKETFQKLTERRFKVKDTGYHQFLKALIRGNIEEMESALNRTMRAVLSFHDAGKNEAEKFYHGLVLGMMTTLMGRYRITSNRESGFGRYDIMMRPVHSDDPGIIIEFKVFDNKREKCLEETVCRVLTQIKEKEYAQELISEQIEKDRIHVYAFGFKGKEVLIKEGTV